VAAAILSVGSWPWLFALNVPLDLLRIPVFALSMGSSLGAFCAQMLAFLSLQFLLLAGLRPEHATSLDMAWRLALCGAGFALLAAVSSSLRVRAGR
jgi:hypothetical protein